MAAEDVKVPAGRRLRDQVDIWPLVFATLGFAAVVGACGVGAGGMAWNAMLAKGVGTAFASGAVAMCTVMGVLGLAYSRLVVPKLATRYLRNGHGEDAR